MRKRTTLGYAIGATTAITIAAALAGNAHGASAPDTPPTSTTTVAPATTTTVPPTTTTTTAPPPTPAQVAEAEYLSRKWHPCAEWFATAVQAGWPIHLVPDVLDEMHSESRCMPIGPERAYPTWWAGETVDPWGTPYWERWNRSDWGLMQINKATHEEYVVMLYGDMDAMVNPLHNLEFAWRLYSEREAKGKCGFKAWSRPCAD